VGRKGWRRCAEWSTSFGVHIETLREVTPTSHGSRFTAAIADIVSPAPERECVPPRRAYYEPRRYSIGEGAINW
jgi:hypothetical protein